MWTRGRRKLPKRNMIILTVGLIVAQTPPSFQGDQGKAAKEGQSSPRSWGNSMAVMIGHRATRGKWLNPYLQQPRARPDNRSNSDFSIAWTSGTPRKRSLRHMMLVKLKMESQA